MIFGSMRLLAVVAFLAIAAALWTTGCLKTSDEDYDGDLTPSFSADDEDTDELGPYCQELADCLCGDESDTDYDDCVWSISTLSESECESYIEDYC